jgi:hypothetical protein
MANGRRACDRVVLGVTAGSRAVGHDMRTITTRTIVNQLRWHLARV